MLVALNAKESVEWDELRIKAGRFKPQRQPQLTNSTGKRACVSLGETGEPAQGTVGVVSSSGLKSTERCSQVA